MDKIRINREDDKNLNIQQKGGDKGKKKDSGYSGKPKEAEKEFESISTEQRDLLVNLHINEEAVLEKDKSKTDRDRQHMYDRQNEEMAELNKILRKLKSSIQGNEKKL